VVADSTFLVPDSADFDSIGGLWIPAHSDTLAAWRLDWSDGHRTAELWVDSRGLPIRVTSLAGFSLDRSAFEIVNINYRRQREDRPALRAGSVIPETSIAAGVTPDSGVRSMRIRLTAQGRPVAIPADSPASLTHSMENGDLVIRRVAPDSTATAPDSVLAPWLGDAPLLGIGDTVLARQARRIIGDASTPGSKARRLVAWVSRTIRRAPDLNLPRAATVLREGQADVDGHTLLFLALARGSGLPARPVSGILLAGGRFYLHSWAEVYAGGWVAVDPTWGEFPAGANRVGMARGLLARPLDLLPLVGGLDAELITFTQGP
jgi:hypothetical protein